MMTLVAVADLKAPCPGGFVENKCFQREVITGHQSCLFPSSIRSGQSYGDNDRLRGLRLDNWFVDFAMQWGRSAHTPRKVKRCSLMNGSDRRSRRTFHPLHRGKDGSDLRRNNAGI